MRRPLHGLVWSLIVLLSGCVSNTDVIRALAENGQADAQFQLAARLWVTTTAGRDAAEALQWFHKAAVQGHAEAQFRLGTIYANGQRVQVDYDKAVYWYRKAAEQWHAEAQLQLAIMALEGHGMPRNYPEALRWLTMAAIQGNVQAELRLGEWYEAGKIVPQDFALAHVWWNAAACRGSHLGTALRDYVSIKMTPDQLERAEKLFTRIQSSLPPCAVQLAQALIAPTPTTPQPTPQPQQPAATTPPNPDPIPPSEPGEGRTNAPRPDVRDASSAPPSLTLPSLAPEASIGGSGSSALPQAAIAAGAGIMGAAAVIGGSVLGALLSGSDKESGSDKDHEQGKEEPQGGSAVQPVIVPPGAQPSTQGDPRPPDSTPRSPYLEVKDFGAKGDGVTDDTDAVQAWLEAVASSGTAGYASPGRYRLTRPVTVTPRSPGALTILGTTTPGADDPRSAFVLDADLPDPAIPLLLVDCAAQPVRITMRDLALLTDGKTGSGLSLHACQEPARLEHLRIRGFAGSGLVTKRLAGLTLLETHLEENGTGWEQTVAQNGSPSYVLNSHFGFNRQRNILLDTESRNILMLGSTVYGHPTIAGIELADGASGISLHNMSCATESPCLYIPPSAIVRHLTLEGLALRMLPTDQEARSPVHVAGTLTDSRITQTVCKPAGLVNGTAPCVFIRSGQNNTVEITIPPDSPTPAVPSRLSAERATDALMQ